MTSAIHHNGLVSGRQLVLLGTAVLHVLVYQVLSLTLGFHPVGDAADHIMKAFFVEDRVVVTQPPRPPTATREAPSEPLLKDPPLPVFTFDPEHPVEPGPGETLRTQGPPEEGAAGGGVDVPQTALRYTALRPTDDFYPPAAIRLGEEGATVLRVCVGAAGQLQGTPRVTAGSGHPRLDAAAVAWASQALAFTPASRDGVPVQACKDFRVSFRLRD